MTNSLTNTAGDLVTPDALTFTYTNWRGETDVRFVDVAGAYFHFGSTEWHGEPQWLFRAHDRVKAAFRDFAVKDIVFAASPAHATGAAMRESDFLQRLRAANIARDAEYRAKAEGEPLPVLFRTTEFAGEVGELLNVVKKMERERLGWSGKRATREMLLEEFGGVVATLDLLAMALDVDLAAATAAEFNAVTDRLSLTTRLAALSSPAPEGEAAPVRTDADGVREAAEKATTEVLSNITSWADDEPRVLRIIERAIRSFVVDKPEGETGPTVAIPTGWHLVPEVPTEAQMNAGLHQSSHDATYADVCQSYMDMVRTPVDAPDLTVSPSPSERDQHQGEITEEVAEAMAHAGYDATRLADGTPQFAGAGFCIGHAVKIYEAMEAVRLAALSTPKAVPVADKREGEANG